MKIGSQFLMFAVYAMLSSASALGASEGITLENVVSPGPNRSDEPLAEKFSMQRAVRFLDSAALTWQKQRKCFSCHSNYVYLMARPAITHEVTAHRQIREAAEFLATHPRKTGYQATEAVMIASVMAQNDAATTGKLHPATRQALDRMWEHQREDGGWKWLDDNEPPSEIEEHYGVTMAAIGAGIAPDDYSQTPAASKGIENIRRYLRDNPPANVHNQAMKMLASLHVDGIMTNGERQEVVENLFALQKPDGGWNLATLGRNWKRADGTPQDYETSDGYGTGFAVYVLRTAGVTADDPRIQMGIRWLKANQRASGRWFTRSMDKDSRQYITHSGTAYSILALAACGETAPPTPPKPYEGTPVTSERPSAAATQAHKGNRYNMVEAAGEWQLLCEGQPFYIKGAVGWQHFDVLKDCGANAVRTRASKRSLDQAHEYGLAAMAGLPVRGERNGMDWSDQGMVTEQQRKVLRTVEELKDHPALMFWAVGNELDWIPPGRPHHPELWDRLNDIAIEIKRIDPCHPVLTVVGTGSFERKIQQIAEHCTDFDLLGINTYGDIDKVVELASKHWPKPFVIAEWGPTGHWQVPKTQWRVPMEQTSTEKAQAVFDRYTKTMPANRGRCLGSFVFLWGQKQETTHTWYGMFRDGLRTESVDVMQYLWSGSWPENRAPAVLDLSIPSFADKQKIYLEPSKAYHAGVVCYDSDYDALAFEWDIRPEVDIPGNSYAGSMENPARPIRGLIEAGRGPQIAFTSPAKDGPYRLFVQVSDSRGHAGYANLPFYVKSR